MLVHFIFRAEYLPWCAKLSTVSTASSRSASPYKTKRRRNIPAQFQQPFCKCPEAFVMFVPVAPCFRLADLAENQMHITRKISSMSHSIPQWMQELQWIRLYTILTPARIWNQFELSKKVAWMDKNPHSQQRKTVKFCLRACSIPHSNQLFKAQWH